MRPSRLLYYVTLFAGLLVLHIRLAPYANDDAYIHIRIAQHLAFAGQPYFNLGEPVMGSSSAVWTMLLAGAIRLGASVPMVIALINALLTTICLWIYAELLAGERQGPSPFWVDFAVTAAVVPIVLGSSLGLMETPLALAVAGVGLLLWQRERPAAFVFLALSAFVRLEFIIVPFVVAALSLRTQISRRAALLYAFAAILPIVAFEFAFFGTLIPHTVYAKSRGYQLSFWETAWLLGANDSASSLAGRTIPTIVAIGLLWQIALRQGRPRVTVAALGISTALLAAYLMSRTLVFSWYQPLYMVPLVWTALALLRLSPPASTRTPQRLLCVCALAVLVVPQYGRFGRYLLAASSNPAYSPSFDQGARAKRYIELGRELATRFPEHRLMSSEIGGLGFGFRGPVDDGFGLVSPAALKFHPMRVPEGRSSGMLGAIPAAYIAEAKPTLIVSYDIFVEEFLKSPERAKYLALEQPVVGVDDTRMAGTIGRTVDVFGARSLLVFIRKDVLR